MFDAYQYLNQYIISQVINSELRSTFTNLGNLESFFYGQSFPTSAGK